jgi:hypothetical protein
MSQKLPWEDPNEWQTGTENKEGQEKIMKLFKEGLENMKEFAKDMSGSEHAMSILKDAFTCFEPLVAPMQIIAAQFQMGLAEPMGRLTESLIRFVETPATQMFINMELNRIIFIIEKIIQGIELIAQFLALSATFTGTAGGTFNPGLSSFGGLIGLIGDWFWW